MPQWSWSRPSRPGGEIMQDALLTDVRRNLRDEVRAFVRDEVPRQLILDMDAGKVSYPREFLEAAARRRLLGLRFDEKYGGGGGGRGGGNGGPGGGGVLP